MHRGNILVRRTHQETVYIRLDNRDYYIETHGVLATVVDYTLSRIKQSNKVHLVWSVCIDEQFNPSIVLL